MTAHRLGTREDWLAAREQLLEREKRHTREGDELARLRRELPWVRIEKPYRFETDDGPKDLAELFEGRSQLLIYHFMFGEQYAAGCPVCSSAADIFDRAVVHLRARDASFACVSRAPLERLRAYERRMGWSFPWVSSRGSDFNFDFRVSQSDEQLQAFVRGGVPAVVAGLARACGTDPAGYLAEAPGFSSFALEEGVVYHTYSAYARGLEFLMGYYPILDRAAKGRNESDEPLWIRRHDEYPHAGEGSGDGER